MKRERHREGGQQNPRHDRNKLEELGDIFAKLDEERKAKEGRTAVRDSKPKPPSNQTKYKNRDTIPDDNGDWVETSVETFGGTRIKVKLFYQPYAVSATSYVDKRKIWYVIYRKKTSGDAGFLMKRQRKQRKEDEQRVIEKRFSDLYHAEWLGSRGRLELDAIREAFEIRARRIQEHLGVSVSVD